MQTGLDGHHSPPQQQQNGVEHNELDASVATTNADDTALTNTPKNLKTEDAVPESSQPFNNDEPPVKRRRLTDSLAPQRLTPRASSPPWKNIAAEGPTTFFEEGKRKSARTNFLPVELQPHSTKRRTRAAIQTAASSLKTKYGGPTTAKSSPLATVSTPQRPVSRHLRTPSRSGPQPATTTGKSPGKHQAATTSSKRYSLPAPAPPKRAYRKRVKAEPSPPPLLPSSPVQKRGPGRPRKSDTIKKEQAELLRQHKHESEEDDDDEEDSDDGEEEEESDDDEEMEDAPVDPNFKSPRLKLRVRMPTLTPQHPAHIPRPKKFSSFRQWLEQDDPLDGTDSTRLTEKEAKREAHIRRRIVMASEDGGVLSIDKCSAYVSEEEEVLPRQYSRHDHLLAHAQNLRTLMLREHRKHAAAAKKLAYACLAKWKENQPKSEEEIRLEQEDTLEATLLATKQQLIRDLSLKFDMIRAEVDRWRLERWEEEQEVLGKQALNKVLEQSTQLLDARRRRNTSEMGSDEEDGEETGLDGDDNALDSEAGSKMEVDDQNMSSDESESDDGEGADVDANLSVEELRRKYESRNVGNLDRPPEDDGGDVEMILGDSNDTTANATPLQDPNLAVTPDLQEKKLKSSIQYPTELDESALNETDESTDMDDDMGSSDEESDDEDDETGESESEQGGLLGFFSKEEVTADPGEDTTMETESQPIPDITGPIDDMEEEEIEEVSLIPDATQVQTPSASNSETHSVNIRSSETEKQPVERFSQLRESSTIEDVTPEKQDMSSLITLDQDTDMDPDSLPATPVSSKPLKTAVPSLLRGTLREYQHYGLDWLAGLYANGTNGILADEMGLGKTIQTISLLAHLAVEHEVWGTHLIVVPTSVMLNWEMEFKKFLPGFKILTYYGNPEERKQKRKGWLDDDKWNVVITSYNLVLADAVSFKKRGWHYLVLDEAHNIKNFQSQRWQTLLTFRTHSRLLLTGTPLQNNLTELWSLMFFLMPSDSTETGIAGFANLEAFTTWFKKPVDQILEQGRETMDDEAKEIVQRLHSILRPYLLRRLKADVEKQMPLKYEHVIYCKLSKRQRYLYDGFMSMSQTRETLARGNYLSIINCLMQLRKVCNHPDLFETRQIVTSFAMPRSAIADYEIKELLVRRRLLHESDMDQVSLGVVNLVPGSNGPLSALDTIQPSRLGALGRMRQLASEQYPRIVPNMDYDGSSVKSSLSWMANAGRYEAMKDLHHHAYLTSLRSQQRPLYSHNLMDILRSSMTRLPHPPMPKQRAKYVDWLSSRSSALEDMILTLPQRSDSMKTAISKFGCVTPTVVAAEVNSLALCKSGMQAVQEARQLCPVDSFHEPRMRLSIAFPDKRLLQYDCGKLQRLDALLRTLQAGGHRALIFTQMVKVLDILEQFLNIHGHRYLRLDGATKVEQRQILTDRFNNDPKILAFILSSRSGGLGINLTGADTVIFYDLDWNPAMDKQCQDRCHRIGQTRDVHIYRFVSEYTIEANILRKANQKRLLDDVIIQEGDFTTDHFTNPNHRTLPEDDDAMQEADPEASAAMDRVLGTGPGPSKLSSKILEHAEDKEDILAAQVAEKEVHADEVDFAERTNPSGGPTRTASRAMTPHASNALQTPTQVTVGDDEADADPDYLSGSVLPRTDMAADIFREKDPIGVDRYLVEFLEWELEDVPVGPPAGAVKKAKKRAGEAHRVRKR